MRYNDAEMIFSGPQQGNANSFEEQVARVSFNA